MKNDVRPKWLPVAKVTKEHFFDSQNYFWQSNLSKVFWSHITLLYLLYLFRF